MMLDGQAKQEQGMFLSGRGGGRGAITDREKIKKIVIVISCLLALVAQPTNCRESENVKELTSKADVTSDVSLNSDSTIGSERSQSQLSRVHTDTDVGRQLEPVSVGIAIGVGATAAWFLIDSLLLKALYYGYGVASVDDTPTFDDDAVTRTGWLFENYVDFNADQNIFLAGHAHEERHYFIPHQRWSAVYPIKEFVFARPNHKAERGWELRKKGIVIAKGKGRRTARNLADHEDDPIWSFRLATREETVINFTMTIDLSPEDMTVNVSGTSATVSFDEDVRDFVDAPNPFAALSWGLNTGSDVNSTDMPSSFDITVLDVRWEIDDEITLSSAGGKTDDDLRREAIAGAVRLVPGERAGGGWSPPPDLGFAIDDLDETSDAYLVSRSTTVHLDDLMKDAGFDGLYIYEYVGPGGEPDATTPLPTNIPDDGVEYTISGSEAGGALAVNSVPPGESLGACCVDSTDDGCTEVTQGVCESTPLEGTYQGDGTTCPDSDCPTVPRGACCDTPNEACVDKVLQTDCDYDFAENETCTDETCPMVVQCARNPCCSDCICCGPGTKWTGTMCVLDTVAVAEDPCSQYEGPEKCLVPECIEDECCAEGTIFTSGPTRTSQNGCICCKPESEGSNTCVSI